MTKRRGDSPAAGRTVSRGPGCASAPLGHPERWGQGQPRSGFLRDDAALLIRNETLGTEGGLQTVRARSPSRGRRRWARLQLISCVIASFLH